MLTLGIKSIEQWIKIIKLGSINNIMNECRTEWVKYIELEVYVVSFTFLTRDGLSPGEKTKWQVTVNCLHTAKVTLTLHKNVAMNK